MSELVNRVRLNKDIFKDTLRMCSENEVINEAILRSISGQCIIKESEEISIPPVQYNLASHRHLGNKR